MNKVCQNAETHETLYYCDVYDDSSLEIHRGTKYGPVIAKSSRCRSNPGATDFLLTDRRAVQSAHIHHDERRAATHFTENGRGYHWNGQSELVEDGTGHVVAQLSSVVNDGHRGKSGKLVIRGDNQRLRDPIVMTAMMLQEQADEAGSYF